MRALAIVLAASAWPALPVAAAPVLPTEEALAGAGERFDFALWDQLLGKYVDGAGTVDYQRLRGDPADRRTLERLYAQVARQKAEELPSRTALFAFYLDAYNLLVWKNVVDNRPPRVDEGQFRFFHRQYLVAGQVSDLDGLEKKIIGPLFRDPRMHVALNCASAGCPQLPAFAFVPEQLEAQLDTEARRFCNDPRNVAWDPVARRVTLSEIFRWYEPEFAPTPLDWLNRYRKVPIPKGAQTAYAPWDWRLNDRSLRR